MILVDFSQVMISNIMMQLANNDSKLEEWTLMQAVDYCTTEMLENYIRNKTMVDLDYIPEELQKQIVDAYATYKYNPRNKIFNYFVQHKLRQLTDAISEF